MQLRFTDRTLRALHVEKQTDFYDEDSSLILRVDPDGRKTFSVRYRFAGKQRRDWLGRFPRYRLAKAREEAEERVRKARKGIDPRPRVGEGLTFGKLAEKWFREKKHLRSIGESRRSFEVELKPHWGGRPAEEIRRSDARELLRAIRDRGSPIQSNRVRALISSIYNFGIAEELVEHNPCFRLKPFGVEKPAERTLSESEIRRLWKVLEEEGSTMARLHQSLLVLGQRTVEVRTGRLSDIDGSWWTIPAETVKGKREHGVFLPKLQLELLRRVKRFDEPDWWFPSSRKPGHPIGETKSGYRRYQKRCGFEWTPHDLRRTVYTHMCGLGIEERIVERVMGHSIPGVGPRHYNRWMYAPEKKRAMLRWERELLRIIKGRRGKKVVPIHAASESQSIG